MILIEFHPALHISGIYNPTILDSAFGIHAYNIFADSKAGSSQGRTDSQAFPVVLGNIGRTYAGDNPWITKFYPIVFPEFSFNLYSLYSIFF